MSLHQEIQIVIREIFNKAQATVIFKNKCQIVAGILKDILYVLEDYEPDPKTYQKQLQDLKLNLTKVLNIIDDLQDDKKFLIFLINNQPIQQYIIDINNAMKNINLIMQELGVPGSFKMPSDELFNDYDQIDNLLLKALDCFQKRRKEVEYYLKQSQATAANDDYTVDNIDELNKHPQYKLSRSEFDYNDNKRIDYNNIFDYYQGTMKDQQVTVMKLRDHSIFKRLLSVLTTIDHPYVEKFLGACIDQNRIFLITNRNGINLATILENRSNSSIFDLQPGDMTILIFKIAQAMSYLHSRSVVHRNLTTLNIFVNKEKNDQNEFEIKPTIVGFRNSRLIPNSIGMSCLNINSKLPVSYFMAPELDDGDYDEKVDVFSFSGILYQILTGEIPFPKISRQKVLKLLNDNQRPELLPSPAITKELIELINSCWSQDPTQRCSFDQFINKMIDYKIVLPGDESNREKILRFYEENRVKSNNTKKVLDLFNSTKYYIGQTFQFRFEFLRARSLLSSYENKLKSSFYAKKEELNDEEKSKMQALYDSLIEFQNLALNNSEEKWQDDIQKVKSKINDYSKMKRRNVRLQLPYIKTFEVIDEITQSMTSIYETMVNLGFNEDDSLTKYSEVNDDLLFDLRELSNFLPVNMHKYFRSKVYDIDNFIDERDLDCEFSDQAIQRRLRDLFSQFKDYELNQDDIVEIDHDDQELTDEEIIGDGATSLVFKKLYKSEPVAVKKLTEYNNCSEKDLSLLRREIGYLTRLKHPYIAEFVGFILSDEYNVVWLISKYVKNGTLQDVIHNGYGQIRLNGTDKTKIAFRIAVAMEFVHSHNIVHLDLKPGNILMDDQNVPKLIDFGYSGPNNKVLLLNRNCRLGTLRYMAPEVFSNSPYDKSADVFSFAVTLWHLLAEKVPFFEEKDNLIVAKSIADGARPQIGGDVSDGLRSIMERSWSGSPELRPSFKEIINEMMNRYVMFPGANEADVRAFYDEESQRRTKAKLNLSDK